MRRTAVVLAIAVTGTLFAGVQAANACVGEVCDVVNAACEITRGQPCVR